MVYQRNFEFLTSIIFDETHQNPIGTNPKIFLYCSPNVLELHFEGALLLEAIRDLSDNLQFVS